MPTETQILDLVRSNPGLRGSEIATRLEADTPQVSAVLWKLRDQGVIQQDRGYRWSVIERRHGASAGTNLQTNTSPGSLGRLCKYYLDCLGQDDEAGVKLFARSQFALEYSEVPEVPGLNSSRPIASYAGVEDLFKRLRADRDRKVAYLGYPVLVKRVRSAKWEGQMLMPVFLLGLGEDALRPAASGHPEFESPSLNPAIVRAFAYGSDQSIMAEAARLADELGLGEPESPPLDDLIQRLIRIRESWPWKEPIDPSQLSAGSALSQIDHEGLYNRCIVFGHERSPFTKGLELELARLAEIPESRYRSTALGFWLHRQPASAATAAPPLPSLLEPLPLNTEQREAVTLALTAPLTVITGPPGTGKSQVVSSILINAARQGKRVLFASKNNKAVDVVEARVNSLGPRPILLRLGRGEYQSKLSSYLTTLLAARATDGDQTDLAEAEAEYRGVLSRMQALEDLADRTISIRNEVDALERQVEPLRGELGTARFQSFRTVNHALLRRSTEDIRSALVPANRRLQPPWVRLLWFLFRAKRFEELGKMLSPYAPLFTQLGRATPNPPTSDADLDTWEDWLAETEYLVKLASQVRKYSDTLERLAASPALEDVWKQLAEEKSKVPDESLKVWSSWLKLAPTRLSARDRELLGEFSAVLRILIKTSEDGQRAGSQIFSQYHRLFPSLVNILSCWGITSLSARGRIPLEPGFFDLVVVDEASQCDIASALPLLFRAKAAVIIGDPQQLRHITGIPSRRDRELLQKHSLTDGFAKWAYSENSLFDLACPLAAQGDLILLRDHHRSHAHIIEFSNQQFYEGKLRVATRHDRLNSPSRSTPAIRWIAIQGSVTSPGSGALNDPEASAVLAELHRLVIEQGYRGTVGVVTPFRAQANRIRELVEAHPQANVLLDGTQLLVDTVHRFQGDERDVILFSPVISEGITEGAVGFLRKTGNLFNVAITRARAALVVIGDPAAARESGVDYLSAFAAYVDGLTPDSAPSAGAADVDSNGPEYPNVSNPHQVSEWERILYRSLWEKGLRPTPQYPEEKFVLDLALFDGTRKLNIEVDGERYHRDWNGELLRRDQMRNMRMMELGWDVMRFWVYQIRDDLPTCIQRVQAWVEMGKV